jgi:pyruvate dehydrogenase E2 component (dihydrolipoamide acetyltransferase)
MREVFVPAMGMAPDDVILVSWLKAPGETVAAGDVVALVETSKAELEIEAEAAGVLGRQLYAEHATIPPGTTITHLLEPGETEPGETVPESTVETMEAVEPERPRHTTSPRQRRLAALGPVPAEFDGLALPADDDADAPLDPAAVRPDPTTPGTPAASPPAASPPAAPAPVAAEEPSTDRFRAAISASVVRSWQEIPHFAVTRELRVGQLTDLVREWRAVLPGLTLTDLLLRGLALALLERERRSDLDLGLAVATDRGVAIPVIRDVLNLGLVELVDARTAAVERARTGKRNKDDGRTPASTLSNLGAVGVDQFTGVIPYGQTSMLTVGRAAPRPVVEDGQLAVATTMQATLNVDHRDWDGRHAGEALDRLARILTSPNLLQGGSRHD